MKNDEILQLSYKEDYEYYIKNPNILADNIFEIYDNNPNSSVLKPNNKDNLVKLYNVITKIERDRNIGKKYKEFVKEFKNIPDNAKIEYDYQTYKNLVLDKINNEKVSTSNDNSFVKEVGKKVGK